MLVELLKYTPFVYIVCGVLCICFTSHILFGKMTRLAWILGSIVSVATLLSFIYILPGYMAGIRTVDYTNSFMGSAAIGNIVMAIMFVGSALLIVVKLLLSLATRNKLKVT